MIGCALGYFNRKKCILLELSALQYTHEYVRLWWLALITRILKSWKGEFIFVFYDDQRIHNRFVWFGSSIMKSIHVYERHTSNAHWVMWNFMHLYKRICWQINWNVLFKYSLARNTSIWVRYSFTKNALRFLMHNLEIIWSTDLSSFESLYHSTINIIILPTNG